MNTIKFTDKKILTTEQSNLELMQTKEVTLFGQTYTMKIPCNLNIFITNSCHNRCDFCINNQKYYGKMCKICLNPESDSCSSCKYNINYICNNNLNIDKYLYELEHIFEEFKKTDAPIEITITGGEPTLDIERLVKVMQLCKKYRFNCRTFSTTGKGLFELYNGIPLYKHLVDNEFIHNINISRMSIDDNINDSIMNGHNITNNDIEMLAAYFKYNNADMRISCNLLPQEVNTLEKLLEFENFFRNLGVESIMFREVISSNHSKIVYPKLSNILSKTNMPNEFSYIDSQHSNTYDVDVYSYKNTIVKYYMHNNLDKDINEVSSLSFNNGILKLGFNGKRVN